MMSWPLVLSSGSYSTTPSRTLTSGRPVYPRMPLGGRPDWDCLHCLTEPQANDSRVRQRGMEMTAPAGRASRASCSGPTPSPAAADLLRRRARAAQHTSIARRARSLIPSTPLLDPRASPPALRFLSFLIPIYAFLGTEPASFVDHQPCRQQEHTRPLQASLRHPQRTSPTSPDPGTFSLSSHLSTASQ